MPEPQREFRFCERRWRFDLAWVDRLLAVELQGGEFSQGRHSRGVGMANDARKWNAATLQGWTVLVFTGAMVKSGEALDVLRLIL